MQEVFGDDCSSWEFKALRQHLFLDRPPRPIRIPQWDLDKVLALLQTKKFCQQPGKFLLAKKTAFFLALATTNRVSELSAVIRNGKGTIRADAVLRLPLRPGFLFKNQREGRTPPPIEVHPLSAGPRALCTVRSLRKYLRLTGDVVSGPLFLNSRTSTPVLSSTVSKWLSEVIEEAGPGS